MSGNGRHGMLVSGSATKGTGSGHGASNQIEYVQGSTASVVEWPSGSIPSTFTVCSVTRYTSTTPTWFPRLLQCIGLNWLHGHWNYMVGSTYYNGYGNLDQYPVNTPSALGMSSLTDWVVTCGRNTQVPGQVGTIANGITTSTAAGGSGNCQLCINSAQAGVNSNTGAEVSDWALSRLYVWDYHLPDDAFFGVSDALMDYLAGTSECPQQYTCSSADFLLRTTTEVAPTSFSEYRFRLIDTRATSATETQMAEIFFYDFRPTGTPCLPFWRQYGQKCYRHFSTSVSQSDARQTCLINGGDLATPTSAEENAFVNTMGSGGKWIAPNDLRSEGSFTDLSGQTLPFTAWAGGEPNDAGSNEDCTVLDSYWYDLTCSAPRSFLCEMKAGMGALIQPSAVVNPSGSNPVGKEPDKIADLDLGTKWVDFNKEDLVFTFSSPVALSAYKWVTGDDFEIRDPVHWTLDAKEEDGSWLTFHVSNDVAQVPTNRIAIVGPFELEPPCQPGQFKHGEMGCLDCEAGKYSETAGASACVDCEVGKRAPDKGMGACIECEHGNRCRARISAIPCAAGEL